MFLIVNDVSKKLWSNNLEYSKIWCTNILLLLSNIVVFIRGWDYILHASAIPKDLNVNYSFLMQVPLWMKATLCSSY